MNAYERRTQEELKAARTHTHTHGERYEAVYMHTHTHAHTALTHRAGNNKMKNGIPECLTRHSGAISIVL